MKILCGCLDRYSQQKSYAIAIESSRNRVIYLGLDEDQLKNIIVLKYILEPQDFEPQQDGSESEEEY